MDSKKALHLDVQPAGDHNRVHLVMISGADNRAKQINRTFEVCRPYFDTISLTDTGATDDTVAVAEKHGARVFKHELNDLLGLAHKEALDQIPTGEWVYFCDSDECPSYSLLANLRYLVERGNTLGIDKWSLPCLGHTFDLEGNLIGDSVHHLLHARMHEFAIEEKAFRSWRLLKKKDVFVIDCNGSHYAMDNWGNPVFTPLPWNHYKGHRSRCKSMFIHALSHPDHQCFGGPEAAEWLKLRKRLKVGFKEIARWTAEKRAPDEAMGMWLRWEGSEQENARGIHSYVFKYKWDGDEPICTNSCCFYPSDS